MYIYDMKKFEKCVFYTYKDWKNVINIIEIIEKKPQYRIKRYGKNKFILCCVFLIFVFNNQNVKNRQKKNT